MRSIIRNFSGNSRTFEAVLFITVNSPFHFCSSNINPFTNTTHENEKRRQNFEKIFEKFFSGILQNEKCSAKLTFVSPFCGVVCCISIEIKVIVNMLAFYMSIIDDVDKRHRFAEIYNNYEKQMFFLARTFLDCDADAEDAVHEVFLQIASKHIDTVCGIDNENDLRNYLLKATKNTCLNHQRNREIPFAPEDMPLSHKTPELSDSELVEVVCLRAEADKLKETILALPEQYRDVLYYRLILELSIDEIADTTKQKKATVKKQLLRGKAKLYEMLDIGVTENVCNESGI